MSFLQIDFYSNVLARSVHMNVLLPECEAPEHGFPTLYLLHGMTDDYTAWSRRTAIERYAEAKRIAVVMPDTRLAWYANTHTNERYFDFVSDELVQFTRRMFPRLSRRREECFIAGLSMGGYGALRCALNRPERFSRVATLSGALDAYGVTILPEPLGTAAYWEDVFGPAGAIEGSANDLFAAAEGCASPRPEIWMWCGTEDFLYHMSTRMRDHLRALGYSLVYTESHGVHEWKYWDREIQNVLNWMIPEGGEEPCL